MIDDLLEAAADGVDCDGLRVARHHEGYTFSVPGVTRGRLGREAVRELAAAHDVYVANWAHWHGMPETRRAFCRYVERADELPVPERRERLSAGTTRQWGELSIRASLDGDTRVYDLRHHEDRGADRADLDVHEDPLDARDLVKTDDRGRYRPLKTAPTLPTGWAFADLDAAALVETVEFIYPATVANWHREREENLDVTHYREAAERQTGIYEMVAGLSDEGVANLAAACCADSQCLKRREWDLDGDDELDVPRGEGAFPCREPCSLVIAAARTFTTLEGETRREYTFELTPSEKNQVEAIVEAVADGRVEEVRDADLGDGANRYRARFLRAARFEDGDLCGVPTIQD
jgi:hypothetical protein